MSMTPEERYEKFMNKEGAVAVSSEQYPIHDFTEDPVLEGILIGSKLIKSKNSNPDSMLYDFEKDGGERVAFWGSAILDTRFKKIVENEAYGQEHIFIWYKGKQKTNSGNSVHVYEVAKAPIGGNPNLEKDVAEVL